MTGLMLAIIESKLPSHLVSGIRDSNPSYYADEYIKAFYLYKEGFTAVKDSNGFYKPQKFNQWKRRVR